MARHSDAELENGQMTPAETSAAIELPQEGMLQVIWRRHRLVLLLVIIGVLAGLAYLYKATPIYTSTSRLYVEQSGPRIIGVQEGFMTQSKNYLYTQCELLTSTPILAAVAERPELRQFKTFSAVDNPIAMLRRSVSVVVGKKDDIINVSMDSAYPQEAAQVVNMVVDSYITYQATSKRSTAAEVLKILQKEKDKRDEELAQRYQAILEFKQAHSALSLEDERGNILIQGLARLSDSLTEARIETISAKATLAAAELMRDEPATLRQLIEARRAGGVYVSLNQQETQLHAQISHYQLQLPALRTKLTAEHPVVKDLESKIRRLQAQLGQQEDQLAAAYLEVMRQQWLAAQQREVELQAAFDQQSDEAKDLNVKAAEHAILRSELRRTEQLCDILDSRIKELNVTEDVGALNISILEVARPADKPSKPQKARVMAMALVLSLMLGVALALLLDWTDHRLRSADEITAILGVPVLGTIPAMPGKEDIVARGQKVHQEPSSLVGEAYKTIRTAVYFGVPDGQAKTLLITSPAPGDGKTTLTSNLAIAMAQAGQKTLILDCDFRKPRQHDIFDMAQEPGLSTVLSGQQQLPEVIRHSPVTNLDIITCGPIPVNPSEMLNSEAFAGLIKDLAARYDRIVIDSPPVMAVSDARILGAICDVTLLVLRAEKSTRRAGEQARDGLLSVGARILGAVVNDVQHKGGRYGYYSGYGSYGYGYGYGQSRKDRDGHVRARDRHRAAASAAGEAGEDS